MLTVVLGYMATPYTPKFYQEIREDSRQFDLVLEEGQGWAAIQKPHRKDQDALFVHNPSDDLVVAGVLDGLGSYRESGEVAQAAADYIVASLEDGTLDAERFASDPDAYYEFWFDVVDYATAMRGDGSTTLTMVSVDRSNKKFGYVSIGDSRAYELEAVDETSANPAYENGSATEQLTTDEVKDRLLTNCISTDNFLGMRQAGSRELVVGSRVLLLTDGVFTTDNSTRSFHPEEIGKAANTSLSPIDALTNLVLLEAHWRPDDRTGVIIDA